MQNSKIIEFDGIFLGAAVLLPKQQGWRFVATDQRVRPLHGHIAPTLSDTQSLAKRTFLTERCKYPSATPALPPLVKAHLV